MILRSRLTLVTCALAVVLSAGLARAQSDERLAVMKRDLTLTDEQAKKIEPILAADAAQAAKDNAAAGGDAAKLQALKRARRQKTDEQIDAVLTPDQRTKRLALKAEKKQRAAAPASSPHGAKAGHHTPAAKPTTPATGTTPASPAPSAKPATPAPSAKPPATTIAPKPTPKPNKQP